MSKLSDTAMMLGERLPWPDWLSLAVIDRRVSQMRRKLKAAPAESNRDFAAAMADYPIAQHADAANEQHYELPSAFFELVLGPQRKYSCCYYDTPDCDLAQAEENALQLTADHADLADGQTVLELGCGWGSLSLWMARRYPKSRILSVSNSNSQRAFIEAQAQAKELRNLEVRTADMNEFETEERFDRVVSVEMFEHMANWQALLTKIRGWLEPDGMLFLHVFSHAKAPYRFDLENKSDWIAQHFFTGGIMPSHGLIQAFPDLFTTEAEWVWLGSHYERTARDWLRNFDANSDAIAEIMAEVYGDEAKLWYRRWRLFFLATMGLFGHDSKEWAVSHYRLSRAATLRS